MFRPAFSACAALVFFAAAVCGQENLVDKQKSLSGQYSQLELILQRIAETTSASNPSQAILLKKVITESKDKLISRNFDEIVGLLERKQLTAAVDGQENLVSELLALLKILESENRGERHNAEKEQLQRFLKDIGMLLAKEQNLKRQVERTDKQDLSKLADPQQQMLNEMQALQDRFNEHEQNSQESKSEPKESNSEPSESKKSNSKPQKSEQSESESQPSNSSNNKESKEQEEEDDPNDSPTKAALRNAKKQMKKAKENLEKAEKEQSEENIDKAIRDLQKAKEAIEKILRQLREEELLQTLEKLEERFKQMLQKEKDIRAQNERLNAEGKTDAGKETRQMQVKAGRLAADQQAVVEMSEAALLLLREDGTAQAMTEALIQARFDMLDVKRRLTEEPPQLNENTLYVEDTIIDALKEMLEAVQEAIDDAKERQEEEKENEKNKQNQQQQQVQEEPLIKALAELKMIRSMQVRVNKRTDRCEQEIDHRRKQPNPDFGNLQQTVEELARQQNRISRILHEIKIGRTQ